MAIRKTVSDVSADLREHEAKCEERWKTIFAETEEIKKEINDLNKTIRIATFGSIGFLSTLVNRSCIRDDEYLMHTSDEGFELIKKFEGCELEAYQDAVAGVWTIGYGHTKDVQEGDKWTEEKADFMLWRELEDEYEHYVNALVTVPLNQCQFDALSFLGIQPRTSQFKKIFSFKIFKRRQNMTKFQTKLRDGIKQL
jgi:hypothetical protein